MYKHFLHRIAIIAAWGMLAVTAEAQPTLFVDADAPGGDGLSWQTALNDLEAAVGTAFSSPPGAYNEIRVAEGTYKPDTQILGRQATFHVVNGVAIRGGYPGFDAPNPDDRDFTLHETILSGEIGNAGQQDNLFTVLTGTEPNFGPVGTFAVVDGFTIRDGYTQTGNGAGVWNFGGTSPTYRNCLITHNAAGEGAGMYNVFFDGQLDNVRFVANHAKRGGGLYSWGFQGSNGGVITNCEFIGNSAADVFADNGGVGGGGMYNKDSSPTLEDCLFLNNTASDEFGFSAGGGMLSVNGVPELRRCRFICNAADPGSGGGYYTNFQVGTVFVECYFLENRAAQGQLGAVKAAGRSSARKARS